VSPVPLRGRNYVPSLCSLKPSCNGVLGCGRHLAFDENKNPPLCNLYVSMLQRMGIEADKFGSGNATLTGLEMRG